MHFTAAAAGDCAWWYYGRLELVWRVDGKGCYSVSSTAASRSQTDDLKSKESI